MTRFTFLQKPHLNKTAAFRDASLPYANNSANCSAGTGRLIK